ncbi:cadherin repeat domain-containing protein [Altericroceibacterium spongiae]|uniref:cadherin repeat domain-containing protein n=1 Tax=Altericroceibacterium spongiae TaxID=2320269 RepID=UPI0011C37B8F|nr:cadherin repeat domain-containing protein [Altericroceibacterium spongiae]
MFTIDTSTGALSFKNAPDYEDPQDFDRDNIYNVVVEVSDGEAFARQNVTVTVDNINEAPQILTSQTISLIENRNVVADISGVDLENDQVTYAITGGNDGLLFKINSNTGALEFVDAPDYENPADSNGDNVYEVEVSASDSNGAISTRLLSVTIIDTNEKPVISVDDDIYMKENRLDITTIMAYDGDGDILSYSISGSDANLFSINSDGQLSFVSEPDYENPRDADLDNVYNITVSVSDGVSVISKNLNINITDESEPLVFANDSSVRPC